MIDWEEHWRENSDGEDTHCGVIIYDPETGEPLPGYPDPDDVEGTVLVVPDNGRGLGGDGDG